MLRKPEKNEEHEIKCTFMLPNGMQCPKKVTTVQVDVKKNKTGMCEKHYVLYSNRTGEKKVE